MTDRSTYLGISPPLSYALPSAEEKNCDKELLNYLTRRGDVFESETGLQKRHVVLEKLCGIIKDWAKAEGIKKKVAKAICENGGGIQLKVFGSTRLNVHTPDADIDTLCIAPSFVSRADFFSSFCSFLATVDSITAVSAVPVAYTPVVKFEFENQSIDMIFVSIPQQNLPKEIDVLDDKYLRGLDDQEVRSLNGSRVAEYICKLVPNVDSFCRTLRAIKHWARQRGLYSNVLGFLGGVNYAILVAFVCQKFVNACPATLVRKFFMMFSHWNWPCPIMLKELEYRGSAEVDGVHLPVWNPRANVRVEWTHLQKGTLNLY